MRLLHYSAEPLGEIRDAPEQAIHFKPAGLWVSVKGPDDWPSWCRAEEFGLDRLAYVHEVALRPDAAILRLSNRREIDAFTREYLRPNAYGLPSPSTLYIDWPAVTEKYDGIVIAPYVWARRLDRSAGWYYAWDCASGCIWRARAIERVTLLDAVSAEG